MSKSPIIIWTFRRTGGTSLKSLLFWLSGSDSFEDEAFNDDPPRELGHITASFRSSGDEAALISSIHNSLAMRKNIKHCIETVPFKVTSTVLEQSLNFGYRQVILLRLNEIDRQISLDLARQTGSWGPDEAAEVFERIRSGAQPLLPLDIDGMRFQTDHDSAMLGKLVRLFLIARIMPPIVFFEDLYHGVDSDRSDKFRNLLCSLDIPGAFVLSDSVFKNNLIFGGQNSQSVYPMIPNYADAVAALRNILH